MGLRTGFIALLALVLFGASTVRAVDFPGTGVGPIPDNNPAGLTISFNAASFPFQVGDVRLQLTMTHSFVRDLKVTLISPSGVSRLVIFSRIGLRTTAGGGSADLSGTYTFSDVGKDFWATASPLGGAAIVPPGNYRTSTGGAGIVGNSNDYGGCYTSLAGAFFALTAADAAGVWTLNVADRDGGSTGSVSAAVLSLSPLPDVISRNGFEVAPLGTCKRSTLDFTGIGRSSYVVARSGGSGTPITWFVKENDIQGFGTESNFQHGLGEDRLVTGDWDGDGITDAGVWRNGTPGLFIVRLSSRPSRPLTVPFGLSGDDPRIVDDFNGDGLTDFAVFRAGATAGAVSRTLIRLSSTFVDRDFITGLAGSFPCSGDYDGDGAADIGVQRNAGGGNASFQLYSGLSGATMGAAFLFGAPSSFIVDGNHSGNAVRDITVANTSGASIIWDTRDGAGGVAQPTVTLGVSTDFPLYGDYDGDGLDDYATWRSGTAGQSKFIVRRSTSPAIPIEVFFGQNGDVPVGFTRVH